MEVKKDAQPNHGNYYHKWIKSGKHKFDPTDNDIKCELQLSAIGSMELLDFKINLNMEKFSIKSKFAAAGDQPSAINSLCSGLEKNTKDQVLLGVTGSGKTFTMASVIERLQRPSLVFAPNKILAAQLYSEMKSFFPKNCVE